VCGNQYDKAFEVTLANGEYFCCAHCAGHRGNSQMQDRDEGHRLDQ